MGIIIFHILWETTNALADPSKGALMTTTHASRKLDLEVATLPSSSSFPSSSWDNSLASATCAAPSKRTPPDGSGRTGCGSTSGWDSPTVSSSDGSGTSSSTSTLWANAKERKSRLAKTAAEQHN